VIAEGNDAPGGEDAGGGEGRGRRSEGDLLAERRARRAVESGEHALTLRAEAAEATVRTLETHVTSLQRRLQDAEQEGRRVSELLDAAQASRAAERSGFAHEPQAPAGAIALERELQRASQREYAEQRLRIEVEERASEREREARAELDRLSRGLSTSERDAHLLAVRLETAERELAEAEQAAAAERGEAQRAERALRGQLGELDGRARELQQLLELERIARARAERALAQLGAAQRSAQLLLGSLADTVAHLREAALRVSPPVEQPAMTIRPSAPAEPIATLAAPAPRPQSRPAQGSAGEAQAGEMAESLAVAFERLRARVEQQPPAVAPASREQRPPHKHTMSLIGRTRLAMRRRSERRKQRRAA
jgi:chromosome segregation ATPase